MCTALLGSLRIKWNPFFVFQSLLLRSRHKVLRDILWGKVKTLRILRQWTHRGFPHIISLSSHHPEVGIITPVLPRAALKFEGICRLRNTLPGFSRVESGARWPRCPRWLHHGQWPPRGCSQGSAFCLHRAPRSRSVGLSRSPLFWTVAPRVHALRFSSYRFGCPFLSCVLCASLHLDAERCRTPRLGSCASSLFIRKHSQVISTGS